MGDSKSIVQNRKKDEMKTLRSVAVMELQNARGYDLTLQSTFHQTSPNKNELAVTKSSQKSNRK